jgi:hypothetical protein
MLMEKLKNNPPALGYSEKHNLAIFLALILQ